MPLSLGSRQPIHRGDENKNNLVYMESLKKRSEDKLDCLLIYIPKLNDFYKLIGNYMYPVLIPMGLFAIADFVYRRGFKIQILHLGLERINNNYFPLQDYLIQVNPKVVGLSLHWHHQCYDVIKIAREIKSFNPSIFIVLGGLTVSYFHEEIMREFNFIDAIVRGDGERPFLKLIEEICSGGRNLLKVPNLTWRNGKTFKINEMAYIAGNEDLDDLNFTNFDLLKNYQLYVCRKDMLRGVWLKGIKSKILNKFVPSSFFPVPISRGCLENCSDCGGAKIAQRIICGRGNVSIRSVDKVIDSIKDAQGYGYKGIWLPYLPFDDYNNYYKNLFIMIKNKNIKMNYYLGCWCGILPSIEIIQLFKEACFDLSKSYIEISLGSGSEHIRNLNRDFYFSNNELIKNLEYIASFKIPVILYILLGLPFETMEDIETTIYFQKYLRKKFKNIVNVSIGNPNLEPGSPMYLNPERYDIVKTRSSFKDFIWDSKDNSGFLNSGYFKRNLSNLNKFKHIANEDYFGRELQKVICKNFCILSDFVLSHFLKTNADFLVKLISLCSRICCNVISFYWKLKKSIKDLRFKIKDG